MEKGKKKRRKPEAFKWCSCHFYLSNNNKNPHHCFFDCNVEVPKRKIYNNTTDETEKKYTHIRRLSEQEPITELILPKSNISEALRDLDEQTPQVNHNNNF